MVWVKYIQFQRCSIIPNRFSGCKTQQTVSYSCLPCLPCLQLPMFHLIAEVPVRSLKVGQRFTGIIRDIGNFGLFVDVGAQRDGLVRYLTHQGGAGCSCVFLCWSCSQRWSCFFLWWAMGINKKVCGKIMECHNLCITRWWFQILFMFGNDPISLIFFRWVETTMHSKWEGSNQPGFSWLHRRHLRGAVQEYLKQRTWKNWQTFGEDDHVYSFD